MQVFRQWRRHDTLVDIGYDQDVGLVLGCGARHRLDVQRLMRPGRLSEIFDAAGNVTFALATSRTSPGRGCR
jgi:hypothetical protein